jgi:asparagine synthase (glutamine-hydrolysing)
MCGITGFFNPPRDSGEFPATIVAMLEAISHRGPDGTGYFVDDGCAMGTARLSIIDIESGVQPLSDASGRYWICYNGEVYNYRELRDELDSKGREFRTRCDTEVVLQSWLQWGEACLERFNGCFAFAIYDRLEPRLILARDRFGKRPLFYATQGHTLLFASEFKAFLRYPGFHFEQDSEEIGSILAQWTPLPDQSGFCGIKSLPMGEWLDVTPGQIVKRRYISLRFDGSARPAEESEAIELVRDALEKSVEFRLRSDVEVGVNLSGGLDSAIVALLANDRAPGRLSTFSIEFTDSEFDESPEQHELRAFLGTKHEAVRITHGDIATHFPDAIYHAEVPAFRTAFVPMYLLARRTSEVGIKVVLSGEGADEAFLGYDIFKETILRTHWRELDADRRREWLARLYPHLDHYGPGDIAALTGLYEQFSEERMPGLFSHELRFQNGRFSARLMQSVGDPFRAVSELAANEPAYAAMTPVQKAQWLEFKTLLPGYLLSTQGERMGLAHGVENRCPFLDPHVIDVASSVNLRFDDGFHEKRLLRRAFADRLPASIIAKRKFPYRAPDGAAFAARPPEYLELLLSETELAKLPYLNVKFARALTHKVLSRPAAEISTKENQTFIFLLSLALLHRFFVQRAETGRLRRRPGQSPLVKAVDMRTAR